MTQTTGDTYSFHLGRKPYLRASLLGYLLIGLSLLLAASSAFLGVKLWPTYTHDFTLYLKWQDALLSMLWFCSFMILVGTVIAARFLFALRAGYRDGILILEGDRTLTVRDLSPKNYASIYWMAGTGVSCCAAALIGLVPEILIGWTVHLPHPALVLFATAAAICLSLAGLAVTLVAVSFIIIGLIGAISFTRKMGAPQTYRLTNQTVLRIDGFVLTVIYPDQPESLFDLELLDPHDQRRLLLLLRERWLDAERPWNPLLGEEIEAALEEAQRALIVS